MNKFFVYPQTLFASQEEELCPLPLTSPLALESANLETASLHSLAQSFLAAPTYQGRASLLLSKAVTYCFHTVGRVGHSAPRPPGWKMSFQKRVAPK